VRDHEAVTPDLFDAEYGSVQEHLIATTALSGTHFELDMNSSLLLLMDPVGVL
jgi:hypothetical protein